MADQPNKSVTLGLDIGTTNCKLIAYSSDGHILSEAAAGYELHHPQSGFAELDPIEMMSIVISLLRAVTASITDCDDLSLAISAQGEAFVLVDLAGKPLSSIPVSIDMRGGSLNLRI